MTHWRKTGGFIGATARPAKTIAGALLACAIAFAMRAGVAAPDYAKILADIYAKNPPIVFFVANGAADACGPGCDTWIAAEGRFDDEAAAHLRKLLDQISKRKLPIFFNSIGGEFVQATAIGRMLRARGMTAGVARTLMAHCIPAKSISECGKAILANPTGEAVLSPAGGLCASACSYALMGAGTRLVAPTALVGVHTGPTYFTRVPRGLSERQREKVLENVRQQRKREHARYVAQMGINDALSTIIEQTPFEKMHYLTRAELFNFGVDRRESLLAGWHVGVFEEASIGYAAYVAVPQPSTPAGAPHQPSPIMLALSCRSAPGGGYLLTSLRPVRDASARPTSDLLITAGFTKILLDSRSSFLTSHEGQTLEVRQYRVWRGPLDDLLKAPEIAILEKPPQAKASAPAGAAIAAPNPPGEYTIPNNTSVEVREAMIWRCEVGI
jgi:hypothetical protein